MASLDVSGNPNSAYGVALYTSAMWSGSKQSWLVSTSEPPTRTRRCTCTARPVYQPGTIVVNSTIPSAQEVCLPRRNVVPRPRPCRHHRPRTPSSPRSRRSARSRHQGSRRRRRRVTARGLVGGSSGVDANEQSEPLIITVEEAGRRLGISRGLAYELVRRGEIPAVRLGCRRLVVRPERSRRSCASARQCLPPPREYNSCPSGVWLPSGPCRRGRGFVLSPDCCGARDACAAAPSRLQQLGASSRSHHSMRGHLVQRGKRYYAVVYEGDGHRQAHPPVVRRQRHPPIGREAAHGDRQARRHLDERAARPPHPGQRGQPRRHRGVPRRPRRTALRHRQRRRLPCQRPSILQ